MSDSPRVRPVEDDDAERLPELVSSSMTTSYGLSPEQIETIVDAQFAPDVQQRFAEEDVVALVAEVDDDGETVLAGVVEGLVEDDAEARDSEAGEAGGEAVGTVRWLHVDPERRGQGVGTALFEAVRSALEERGGSGVRAVDLADNTEPGAFYARFGYEKTDESEIDIGGQELVQQIYTQTETGETGDAGAASEAAAEASQSPGEGTEQAPPDERGPDADSADDTEGGGPSMPPDAPDSVTAGDGTEVRLGDDPVQGTEGGFVQTFTDEERTERYGFYCLNCGSTDVSMDSMEQLKCANCGNTHKPDEGYDASYL